MPRAKHLLAGAVAILAVVGLAMAVGRLNESRPAQWITYAGPEPAGPQWALFRARFTAPSFRLRETLPCPRAAALLCRGRRLTLRVKAHRRFRVLINGVLVPLEAGPDWNRFAEADVSAFVSRGENRLEVEVEAAAGKPGLYLKLDGLRRPLRSGLDWEVSANRSPGAGFGPPALADVAAFEESALEPAPAAPPAPEPPASGPAPLDFRRNEHDGGAEEDRHLHGEVGGKAGRRRTGGDRHRGLRAGALLRPLRPLRQRFHEPGSLHHDHSVAHPYRFLTAG